MWLICYEEVEKHLNPSMPESRAFPFTITTALSLLLDAASQKTGSTFYSFYTICKFTAAVEEMKPKSAF